ncbi:hypothetical protein MNBD_NITROSPINAE02-2166 [hydrothermal vent metagenome]|uniref:Uncharacterized protein n=1 Tax=hydrothermal vent metagenome TaxID=652676 RepID=A0A3B1CT02_9ZZZZ
MTAQPKLKLNEIVEKINKLSLADRKNTFLLGQIKRDAQTLRKNDALSASIILGMVASIENNIDEMRSHHENALRINESDFFANINYAASLWKTWFLSEANDYYLKAYETNPSDYRVILNLVNNLLFMGRFKDANSWLIKLEKQFPDGQRDAKKFIEEALDFLNENKISEKDIKSYLDLAVSVLHSQGIFFTGRDVSFSEDEESRSISYEIKLDLPVRQIVDLNWKFAEKLAERDDLLDLVCKVNVSYTPWRER